MNVCFSSEPSTWDSQVPQPGGRSVGTERESPEAALETLWQPCTSRPGQSQHHQGGVCNQNISVGLKVFFASSLSIPFSRNIVLFAVGDDDDDDDGVCYCCRCFLTSSCCRMYWLALTEPWLLSKTCLETLHAGRPVDSFSFSYSYRYVNAVLNLM